MTVFALDTLLDAFSAWKAAQPQTVSTAEAVVWLHAQPVPDALHAEPKTDTIHPWLGVFVNGEFVERCTGYDRNAGWYEVEGERCNAPFEVRWLPTR